MLIEKHKNIILLKKVKDDNKLKVELSLCLLVKSLKNSDVSAIFGPYNIDMNKFCLDFNERSFFFKDGLYVNVKGYIDLYKIEREFIFEILFPKKGLILYQYYLTKSYIDYYLIYLFFFKNVKTKRLKHFFKKYNSLMSNYKSYKDLDPIV